MQTKEDENQTDNGGNTSTAIAKPGSSSSEKKIQQPGESTDGSKPVQTVQERKSLDDKTRLDSPRSVRDRNPDRSHRESDSRHSRDGNLPFHRTRDLSDKSTGDDRREKDKDSRSTRLHGDDRFTDGRDSPSSKRKRSSSSDRGSIDRDSRDTSTKNQKVEGGKPKATGVSNKKERDKAEAVPSKRYLDVEVSIDEDDFIEIDISQLEQQLNKVRQEQDSQDGLHIIEISSSEDEADTLTLQEKTVTLIESDSDSELAKCGSSNTLVTGDNSSKQGYSSITTEKNVDSVKVAKQLSGKKDLFKEKDHGKSSETSTKSKSMRHSNIAIDTAIDTSKTKGRDCVVDSTVSAQFSGEERVVKTKEARTISKESVYSVSKKEFVKKQMIKDKKTDLVNPAKITNDLVKALSPVVVLERLPLGDKKVNTQSKKIDQQVDAREKEKSRKHDQQIDAREKEKSRKHDQQIDARVKEKSRKHDQQINAREKEKSRKHDQLLDAREKEKSRKHDQQIDARAKEKHDSPNQREINTEEHLIQHKRHDLSITSEVSSDVRKQTSQTATDSRVDKPDIQRVKQLVAELTERVGGRTDVKKDKEEAESDEFEDIDSFIFAELGEDFVTVDELEEGNVQVEEKKDESESMVKTHNVEKTNVQNKGKDRVIHAEKKANESKEKKGTKQNACKLNENGAEKVNVEKESKIKNVQVKEKKEDQHKLEDECVDKKNKQTESKVKSVQVHKEKDQHQSKVEKDKKQHEIKPKTIQVIEEETQNRMKVETSKKIPADDGTHKDKVDKSKKKNIYHKEKGQTRSVESIESIETATLTLDNGSSLNIDEKVESQNKALTSLTGKLQKKQPKTSDVVADYKKELVTTKKHAAKSASNTSVTMEKDKADTVNKNNGQQVESEEETEHIEISELIDDYESKFIVTDELWETSVVYESEISSVIPSTLVTKEAADTSGNDTSNATSCDISLNDSILNIYDPALSNESTLTKSTVQHKHKEESLKSSSSLNSMIGAHSVAHKGDSETTMEKEVEVSRMKNCVSKQVTSNMSKGQMVNTDVDTSMGQDQKIGEQNVIEGDSVKEDSDMESMDSFDMSDFITIDEHDDKAPDDKNKALAEETEASDESMLEEKDEAISNTGDDKVAKPEQKEVSGDTVTTQTDHSPAGTGKSGVAELEQKKVAGETVIEKTEEDDNVDIMVALPGQAVAFKDYVTAKQDEYATEAEDNIDFAGETNVSEDEASPDLDNNMVTVDTVGSSEEEDIDIDAMFSECDFVTVDDADDDGENDVEEGTTDYDKKVQESGQGHTSREAQGETTSGNVIAMKSSRATRGNRSSLSSTGRSDIQHKGSTTRDKSDAKVCT